MKKKKTIPNKIGFITFTWLLTQVKNFLKKKTQVKNVFTEVQLLVTKQEENGCKRSSKKYEIIETGKLNISLTISEKKNLINFFI